MIEHDNGKIICNLRREDMLPVTSGDESLFLRFLEVPHPCSDLTCPGNVNRKNLELLDQFIANCKLAIEQQDLNFILDVLSLVEAEEVAGE